MSHVVPVDLEIKDLQALETACKKLGFEFVKHQTTYKWYGKFVGDYPVDTNLVDLNDLGRCDHAIKVPGAEYEIGVKYVGKSYRLEYDFWSGGGLENKVGKDALPIKKAYTIEATKNHAIKNRHRLVNEERLDDRTRLTIRI